MALEEDQLSGAADDPAELLKSLQKKALVNKYLFIAVLCFTGLVFTIMATGMTVMYLKIADLNAAAEERAEAPYDEEFAKMEEQLMLLADFRKSEQKKIQAYTQQLEIIANECNVEKAAPYQQFLLSREQDFQQFLGTLKEGTSSLANMNQGAREWLEPYNAELMKLRQSSAERQNTLKMLMK